MLLRRPSDLLLGPIVLIACAICMIPLSLPVRKGIALAFEYLSKVNGERLLLYEDLDHRENTQ